MILKYTLFLTWFGVSIYLATKAYMCSRYTDMLAMLLLAVVHILMIYREYKYDRS